MEKLPYLDRQDELPVVKTPINVQIPQNTHPANETAEGFAAKIEIQKIRPDQLPDATKLLRERISQAVDLHPIARPAELYQAIADCIPQRPSLTIQQAAEPETWLWLHLKTIISATRRFWSDKPEENDEILQTAITAVWAAYPTLQTGSHISQEVYRVAQNAARRYLAGERNIPADWIKAANDDADQCPQPEPLPNPDLLANPNTTKGAVEKTLLREGVERLLDTLSDRGRIIIELYFGLYSEEKSQKEISQEVGLSSANVSYRMNRSLRQLEAYNDAYHLGLRGYLRD